VARSTSYTLTAIWPSREIPTGKVAEVIGGQPPGRIVSIANYI
jgi:hypothetical protein